MAFERSYKLETLNQGEQTALYSRNFVLLRVIHEENGYVLMTATAGEDHNNKMPYYDLDKLVKVALEIFPTAKPLTDKVAGRPYVRIENIDHPSEIRNIANKICRSLGLPEDNEKWADEELREIYDEFSLGDGENAYLSDGISIDSRGRFKGG